MSTKNRIKVGTIKTISEAGFSAPAYRPANYEIGERWSDDYTDENPAAHGNIVVTEEESSEGRQRSVAVNGSHREVGPWGPTRAQREAHAKREAEKARLAAEVVEDDAAKWLGVAVVSVAGETAVVSVRGERKSVALATLRDAARAPYHPRLTAAQALAQESAEDRQTRLAYRSLIRKSNELR